jgi:chromosome segregation ATPase
MILIKKIRIRYYRSLKEIILPDINHLNIFSGKNDSGKSNILKALDVFFNDKPINFDEDYNKARLAEVRQTTKEKQFIDIRITFCPPKGYSTLPKSITVTKSWDRNGDLIGSPNDDLDRNGVKSALDSFTNSNMSQEQT